MKHILFTPGPTETPAWLREIMAASSLHHRTEEYRRVMTNVRQDLKTLFGAPLAKPLIFPGRGTKMMEAVVANFISPGDPVLVLNTGYFADRWREIAEIYGAAVHECMHEWGYSFDYSCLISTLDKYPIKLVLVQATDTSTGVRNIAINLGRIVKRCQPNALLAVDAVLEAAVSPIKMDLEDIDILIGASQKAFMLPPGLTFAMLNTRALTHLSSKPRAFPFYEVDFRKEIEEIEKGGIRFTPPTEHIKGLHVVLNHILREKGEYRWYEGHKLRAELVRKKLFEFGFSLFTKRSPSYGLSVFNVPEGQNASLIREELEKRGYIIERGLGKIRDSVIRIAHFAGVREEDTLSCIEALKELIISKPNQAAS